MARIRRRGEGALLSHDKDLVHRAVIIRAAEPMAATRGVRHKFRKLIRSHLSKTRATSSQGGEERRSPQAERISLLVTGPIGRRGRLRSDREQRQYAPCGDDVYKLFFESGSFVRPRVTTIGGPFARLITEASRESPNSSRDLFDRKPK
jgi:hypothetical protein